MSIPYLILALLLLALVGAVALRGRSGPSRRRRRRSGRPLRRRNRARRRPLVRGDSRPIVL